MNTEPSDLVPDKLDVCRMQHDAILAQYRKDFPSIIAKHPRDMVAARWMAHELRVGLERMTVPETADHGTIVVPGYLPDDQNVKGGWTLRVIMGRIAFFCDEHAIPYGDVPLLELPVAQMMRSLGWRSKHVRDGYGVASDVCRKWYIVPRSAPVYRNPLLSTP